VSEHELEPVRGLPEPLPEGEHILWQGSPDWRCLARRAFHVRAIAGYFAVLLVARAVVVLSDTHSIASAAIAVLWLLPFAIAAIAMIGVVAWLMARAAVYTITNKRVTMRIGVVLEVTFNLPYRAIESASLREYPDGSGDIPLTLAGDDRIAYAHLWPHARPWRFATPQPMLRAIPRAAEVASLLARALAQHAGLPVLTAAPAANDATVPATPARPLAAAHS
jgi:hypothetical protein